MRYILFAAGALVTISLFTKYSNNYIKNSDEYIEDPKDFSEPQKCIEHKNAIKEIILTKLSKNDFDDLLYQFPSCYKVLKDQGDWKNINSELEKYYSDTIAGKYNHLHPFTQQSRLNRLKVFYPNDKKLLKIIAKNDQKIKNLEKEYFQNEKNWEREQKKLKASSIISSSSSNRIKSRSVEMDFDECTKTIHQALIAAEVPYQYAVNTSILQMVILNVKEGRMILTCSKLDRKMTILLNPEN